MSVVIFPLEVEDSSDAPQGYFPLRGGALGMTNSLGRTELIRLGEFRVSQHQTGVMLLGRNIYNGFLCGVDEKEKIDNVLVMTLSSRGFGLAAVLELGLHPTTFPQGWRDGLALKNNQLKG